MTLANFACLFVAWLVSLGVVWTLREPVWLKSVFILVFLGLSILTISAGFYMAVM